MPAPGDRALQSDQVTNGRTTGGLAAVALFAATGHLGLELVSNFLPVVYPVLVAEAGFSFAQVGTVTLVATLGMTLPQPLLGMLVRRVDAGRLVIAAVLWCGLFYGLVGLAGSFWPLLAVVALGGLGSALFHPAGSVVASAARGRRRGAAMSIFSVGGNAGAALSPLLMAAVLGWSGLAGTLVTIPLSAASGLILVLLSRHGAISAATGALTTTGRRRRRADGPAAAEPSAVREPDAPRQSHQPRLNPADVPDAARGADHAPAPRGTADGARRAAARADERASKPRMRRSRSAGETGAAAAAADSPDARHAPRSSGPAPAAPGRSRRQARLAHAGTPGAGHGVDHAAAAYAAATHAPRFAGQAPAAGSSGIAAGATGTRAAFLALALIVLFAMCRAWYQVSLTTYLPLWVAEHAGARVGIAQVLFVLAGSLPAGAVLGGALSDRVGRWQVVLAAGLLLVPANAGLLAVGPGGGPALLLPLTAAIGCLIGATYPVAIIIVQEAWPRDIGLAGGMIMGLGWLPGGVGASVVGVMADNIGLTRALATQVIPLLVGILAVVGYALLSTRRAIRRPAGRGGKG